MKKQRLRKFKSFYMESKIWHKWAYLWDRNGLIDIENRCVAAEGIGGGMDWEFEISRCKLVYIEWINNNILLYSTGNYIQYPVINHNGKEYEKQIHAQHNHFAVQQKLTEHCKSTILQQNWFKRKNTQKQTNTESWSPCLKSHNFWVAWPGFEPWSVHLESPVILYLIMLCISDLRKVTAVCSSSWKNNSCPWSDNFKIIR